MAISNLKKEKEDLEQYDYYEDDYIEKVLEKYSNLIGLFIIKFNELEHDLDIAIAENLFDDAHDHGFLVVERFTVANKIDFFYKSYLRLAYFINPKHMEKLKMIRNDLNMLNSFRNKIVHANWSTLTKEGFVRTKTIVSNTDGLIRFEKSEIKPKTLRDYIKKIESIVYQIDQYIEKAHG